MDADLDLDADTDVVFKDPAQKYVQTKIHEDKYTGWQQNIHSNRQEDETTLRKNTRTNILGGKEIVKKGWALKNAFCMLKMYKIRMKLSKIRI